MNTTVYVTLQHIECSKCYAIFGITQAANSRLKRSHESFYCPYCEQAQYFSGKSDVEKLKVELAITEKSLSNVRADAKYFKKQSSSYKGQVTKIKKRVSSGVCPCCNRTFKQLRAHMKNKHPDFHVENG